MATVADAKASGPGSSCGSAPMAAQAAVERRFLGSRPPYGYELADAGPHPTWPRPPTAGSAQPNSAMASASILFPWADTLRPPSGTGGGYSRVQRSPVGKSGAAVVAWTGSRGGSGSAPAPVSGPAASDYGAPGARSCSLVGRVSAGQALIPATADAFRGDGSSTARKYSDSSGRGRTCGDAGGR